MREQLQELHNKLFNQEVFIVAGGYSVNDINVDFLQSKKTVAINDSYRLLPNATALFWCDPNWASENIPNLNNHQTLLRFNPRHHAHGHIKDDIKGTAGATILKRSGEYGFDPNVDSVMGNNGGVQCLNLVINMGAKRIYLIGYDMRDNPSKRGQTHFHNNHNLVVRPDIYKRFFIPSMLALHKEVKRLNLGVEIINCSQTSAITCFEKRIVSGLMK